MDERDTISTAPPLAGEDLKKVDRTLSYLIDADPLQFDSLMDEFEAQGGIRTDFYKGGADAFEEDIYTLYPQSGWDTFINTLQATPDAAATYLHAGSSAIRAGASEEEPEISSGDWWTGFAGGLGTIFGSAYAGGKAGMIAGPKGSAAGMILGGSLGAAAVATGIGGAVTGFRPEDIDDPDAGWDAAMDVLFNPTQKHSGRKTWGQLIGKDYPKLSVFQDVTALDLPSEILGIGVTPLIKGVRQLRRTNKAISESRVPTQQELAGSYGVPVELVNETGAVISPAFAKATRVGGGGPLGYRTRRLNPDTKEYAYGVHTTKDDYLRWMDEMEKAGITSPEQIIGALGPKATRKMGADFTQPRTMYRGAGYSKEPSRFASPSKYWGAQLSEDGMTGRTVGDVLNVQKLDEAYPSILDGEAAKAATSSVENPARRPQVKDELDNEFAMQSLRGKTDNIHTITENLEGKDGYIMKKIIRPALQGKKEGQFAFDKAVFGKMKELTGLMRKAGIGNFYEPKSGLVKAGLEVTRVFKRGGANSLKRSRKVIEAIEADDFTKLTKDEGNLGRWLVTNLDKYITDINKIRAKYAGATGGGKPIIVPRQNYFPHVFTLSFFDGLYGDLATMADDSVVKLNAYLSQKAPGAVLNIPEMTPEAFKIFQKETQPNKTYPGWMPWLGNLEPREANMEGWSQNIMTAMERYIEGSERITKMTMPAVRAQKFFNKLAEKGKITREVKEVYDEWIQEGLLGRLNNTDQRILKSNTFKGLSYLTSRMAGNLISGSATFFLNNLTALPTLSSQGIGPGSIAKGIAKTMRRDSKPILGAVFDSLPDKVIIRNIKNTMRGLGFTANNFGMGHAMSKSKVLQNRVHTGYENLGRQALKSGSVSKLLIGIMNSGDQFAVANAFNTAYHAGIKSGLAEDAAVQFGDDIAMKTQAVYGRAYMSKLSRSKVFQTALPFQTWTMQQFSWMRDNVLGKGTARLQFDALTPAQRLGTSMKFLGMAFAINSTYESLGLTAPWDLGSTIPGWDQLKMFVGGGKPTRDANQMAVKNFMDLTGVVAAVNEHGFDMDVPEIRKAVEAGNLFAFNTGGLQLGNRTILGLFDLARGYTTTPQGKNIYLENYPDELSSFMEGLTAATFGSRRTRKFQEYKRPWEGGIYEQGSKTLFPSVNFPVPYVGPGEYKADFGFLNKLTEEK